MKQDTYIVETSRLLDCTIYVLNKNPNAAPTISRPHLTYYPELILNRSKGFYGSLFSITILVSFQG